MLDGYPDDMGKKNVNEILEALSDRKIVIWASRNWPDAKEMDERYKAIGIIKHFLSEALEEKT